MRIYRDLLLVASAIVLADQLTKEWALGALEGGRVIEVIDGILTFRLALNPGGAFGLLAEAPVFFLIATVVVVGAILVGAGRLRDHTWAVPLGLVLGGGTGNLADRIFRDFDGRVVDFVDLQVWPVFNLADSAIVVGVGILLILSFRSDRE